VRDLCKNQRTDRQPDAGANVQVMCVHHLPGTAQAGSGLPAPTGESTERSNKNSSSFNPLWKCIPGVV
jgi:hypothetical protein